MSVADLPTASGNWNVELIREVFCHFDAESILWINSRIVGVDFWSWEKEKQGMYSVRSVSSRIFTLIENEDDTRNWEFFWIYFSNSTTMPCPLRGWRYILIGC
jgi:hypothetical protein